MKLVNLLLVSLVGLLLLSCAAIQGGKENYGLSNLGTSTNNNNYVIATKQYTDHNPSEGLNLEIFKVDHDQETGETTLYATVKDNNGNHIYGLASPFASQNDKLWKKLEESFNNDTIEVVNFTVEEIRDTSATIFNASFVLDYSGSMRNSIIYLENAYYTATKLLRGTDELNVVQFDNRQVTTLPKVTQTNQSNLALQSIDKFGGYTSMYDAAIMGINNLAKVGLSDVKSLGFKEDIAILFTDGGDNSSSNTPNDVLRKALDNNIKLYVIGYAASPVKILEELALYTGGKYYFPQQASEFESIFKDIMLSMNVYYKITYTSPYRVAGDRTAIVHFRNEMADSNLVEPRYYTTDPYSKSIEHDPVAVLAYFDTDAADIDLDKYGDNFQDVVNYLNDYPSIKVKVQGHTDSKASRNYNLTLSKKRANQAKDILIKMGLNESRIIEVEGYAFDKRIFEDDDTDPFKASKNRRVQVEYVK